MDNERIEELLLRMLEERGVNLGEGCDVIGLDALIPFLNLEEKGKRYLEAYISMTLANYLSFKIVSEVGMMIDGQFDLDEYIESVENNEANFLIQGQLDLRTLVDLDDLEPLLEGEDKWDDIVAGMFMEEFDEDGLMIEDEEIIDLGGRK